MKSGTETAPIAASEARDTPAEGRRRSAPPAERLEVGKHRQPGEHAKGHERERAKIEKRYFT
jgi:hypothetical protein